MYKNITKNILHNVTSNNDTYCWKDLTCTYRPWMTALKSFGEKYCDSFLLLVSYIAIYIDRCENKMILDMVKYYTEYLQDYFGISIKEYKVTNKFDMMKSIKTSIDNNMPVLIPCDLINLHYNPMYMLEHRYKCMVVKGYDFDRDLLYILDNIHIDYGSSTILTDFTCYVDEMYLMNKEFASTNNIMQSIFALNKYADNTVTYYTTLKHLNTLIKKCNSDEIKIIHWEKEIINLKKDINYKSKMDEIVKALDFKNVFCDKLFMMLDKFYKDKILISKLKSEMINLNYRWEHIRRTVQYNKELEKNCDYLLKEISSLEEKELIFMNKLSELIDDIREINESDSKYIKGFRILDNSISEIKETTNGILVEHSKMHKYDTWIMQDNATQLLIDNITKGTIETKINFNTGIGEDTHAGIIIKLESGKKYLFGNVRGEHISIFCPELEEDFNLYTKLGYKESNECNFCFKVEVDPYEIRFICLNYITKDPECVYIEKINEKIKCIGLFSKTWEYIEHNVEFYDIIYSFEK